MLLVHSKLSQNKHHHVAMESFAGTKSSAIIGNAPVTRENKSSLVLKEEKDSSKTKGPSA
jgi:hypothetical protein